MEKVNSFLHPPHPTEDDKLLESFQDAWMLNEEIIKDCIHTLVHELSHSNYQFFRSHERLITLFFYAKYYNQKFNFGFDMDEIERLSIANAAILVWESKDDQLSNLEMLKVHFSNNAEIATHVIEETEKVIQQRNALRDKDLFEVHLRNQDYNKCVDIIRHNPSIIKEVNYVFDGLMSTPCAIEFYGFILQLCKALEVFPVYKQVIIEKLN